MKMSKIMVKILLLHSLNGDNVKLKMSNMLSLSLLLMAVPMIAKSIIMQQIRVENCDKKISVKFLQLFIRIFLLNFKAGTLKLQKGYHPV